MKKVLSTLFITINLFALSALFISCVSDEEKSNLNPAESVEKADAKKEEEGELNLRKKVQKEDFDALSFTIYYTENPNVFRYAPWSAEDLHNSAEKITITGEKLEKVLPLLYKLDNMLNDLTEKKSSSTSMDAFLGYTLESSESGVLLDVVLDGHIGGIAIVNGVEMANDNTVFYEVFYEFLPEEVLENWMLSFELLND